MEDNLSEGAFENMNAPYNQITISFEFTVTCSVTLDKQDYIDEKDEVKSKCKQAIINALQEYVDNVDVT
jgi:hypothetical protein